MKVKTSVTLSEDVLEAVEQHEGSYRSRSELIEAAIRAFIAEKKRAEQNAHDLAIIDERADALNEEAGDVLAYQVPL